MKKLWLPPRLYQLLPLVYLFSGLLMVAVFGDESLGRFSGLLLCTAAVLVWALRVHARNR
jgi:drug/metabolite transporter (DMT)-like permease